jgi:hypothetical protein
MVCEQPYSSSSAPLVIAGSLDARSAVEVMYMQSAYC